MVTSRVDRRFLRHGSRLTVLLLVAALAPAGCLAHIQPPPPQLIPGDAGLEGDAGWARVQQVEPGQEVLIDVAPPVEHRPGMSMRPWRTDRPPSGAPPYEVPMRVTTDLVSVDDRAIVVNADAPMTIERSKVMGLSVRTPGETKTREGAFRGIVWGGIVGTLVGLAVRAAAGTAAGIATGGALLGYVTYANWAAPRPGTTPFQRIYRMSPPLR